MNNNKLLVMVIGIISTIVAIVLVGAIFLMEKKEPTNSIVNQQEQIVDTVNDSSEEIVSVNEVIDNYQNYTGRIITIEGISPQNLSNIDEAYIIDTSNKEELLNQPLGQPKFNENRAVLLRPTNRLENIPTVRYGDIIRVKGLYTTRVYNGVYYTYDIIVESIEVVGSIR